MKQFWGITAAVFGSVYMFLAAVYLTIAVYELLMVFGSGFWASMHDDYATGYLYPYRGYDFTLVIKYMWMPVTAFPVFLVYLFAAGRVNRN
jgi:hypothetical protein